MRHMPKAVEILHDKVRTVDGVVVEFKVWQVTRSAQYPEGFKYSFFATRKGVVLVGYDNHRPKGHHRHFGGVEEAYAFDGLEKLRADFRRDLERARKRISEGD
jgi:hypothetical protein